MTQEQKSKINHSNNNINKTVQQYKNISRDRAKLNSFYDFKIDNKKLNVIQARTYKAQKRIFLIGLGFGFFTQYLLGNTRIYQNIVRKATMRRLNAKKNKMI